MRFGPERSMEGVAAQEEERNTLGVLDRAKDAIVSIREKMGTFGSGSKERAVIMGGIMLGILAVGVTPQEAVAGSKAEDKVEFLNDALEDLEEEYADALKEAESLRREAERARRSPVRTDGWMLKFEAQKLEMRARALEKQKDRIEGRRDRAVEKVTEQAERRGQRLEKRGKQSLELYSTANNEIDKIMSSMGIMENGRSLIIPAPVNGGKAYMDIPYELSIDSFRVNDDEFRIVFAHSDGGFFTIEFEDGMYTNQGASTESGRIK